jgi:hypothetical protein
MSSIVLAISLQTNMRVKDWLSNSVVITTSLWVHSYKYRACIYSGHMSRSKEQLNMLRIPSAHTIYSHATTARTAANAAAAPFSSRPRLSEAAPCDAPGDAAAEVLLPLPVGRAVELPDAEPAEDEPDW